MNYFEFVGSWFVSADGYPCYVSMALALNLIMAAIYSVLYGRSALGIRLLWLLAPVVLPVAILICGVALKGPAGYTLSSFAWQACIVYLLFLLHVGISVALIVRFKGVRWLAYSISLVELWLSFGCALWSLIVISNVSI